MKVRCLLHEKHQFRLALCGHQVLEAAVVCLMLMVNGHPGELTLGHVIIASKTGLLSVFPALGLSFTQYARHLGNKWVSFASSGLCSFVADALIHPSHYPGAYTEAALTGLGTVAFSMVVSLTPLGKRIDRLADTFLVPHHSSNKTQSRKGAFCCESPGSSLRLLSLCKVD